MFHKNQHNYLEKSINADIPKLNRINIPNCSKYVAKRESENSKIEGNKPNIKSRELKQTSTLFELQNKKRKENSKIVQIEFAKQIGYHYRLKNYEH